MEWIVREWEFVDFVMELGNNLIAFYVFGLTQKVTQSERNGWDQRIGDSKPSSHPVGAANSVLSPSAAAVRLMLF